MTTLISLPNEMIGIILSYDDISFEDIINFRCVCKKFRWAAKTEEYCFLKKKFYQRWPTAKRYYDKQTKINSEQEKSKKNKQKDKKRLTFIETGIYFIRQLRNFMPKVMFAYDHILRSELRCDNNVEPIEFCLEETFKNLLLREKDIKKVEDLLSKNYYYEIDPEEMRFKEVTKNRIKVLFFMDEMKHLLNQPSRVGYDLTENYCYLKLLDHLNVYWRDYTFKRFEERPYNELLEISATILAQQLNFGRDQLVYSSVKASLNTLALEALDFLREKHPEHSIFSTPEEYFSFWEKNNINDNFWSETEGTQIMDALEEFMFGKLNFRTNESKHLEYMCIDYVLEKKCGNDLIIFTIYESVARRLGLRCDIIIDPELILFWIRLFWSPTFNLTGLFSSIYDRILSHKKYRDIMRCYDLRFPDKFPDCIYKSAPESISYIEKQTFTKMLKSSLHRICYTPKKCEYYGDIFQLDHPSTVYFYTKNSVRKRRPQEIKFAVGMIVRHGDESTGCPTGVIIGWYQNNYDEQCSITDNVSNYVMPLKICSNLASGKRTYYIILTKNHNLCLVEEGDLSLTTPTWIENININRYFHKFEGTHYVPNEEMATYYPHDTVITTGTIFKS